MFFGAGPAVAGQASFAYCPPKLEEEASFFVPLSCHFYTCFLRRFQAAKALCAVAAAVLVLSPMAHAEQTKADRQLSFDVKEGRNLNSFLRAGPVAAHLLLRSGRDPRILVELFPLAANANHRRVPKRTGGGGGSLGQDDHRFRKSYVS